jgi:methionine sulfoxide reductase heme-binding subunit
MDIQLVDVSAVIGLCAMITLTLNVLLGMLLSTAYRTNPLWKKLPDPLKKISLLWLHNWTAYLALTLVLLHPLLLTFDPRTKFSLLTIIYPLNAPHQRIFVSLGTLAMLALVIMIVTTQKKVKKKMSFRLWKNIHLISYGTAMLFIFHGLKMDPELKDRPTDWLDGEKILCELCFIILITATLVRVKYQLKRKLLPKPTSGS